MKQIKPYIFWIIALIVVVVEISLMFFMSPTNDKGDSPETVKSTLDTEYKNLDDLHRRAKKGVPHGIPFDAEKPSDIKQLTDEYLLTEKWQPVMEAQVKKYNQQLLSIRKDLVDRSAALHRPIADSGDQLAWYTAYVGKTKEILINLKNTGALIQPEEATGNNTLAAAKNDEFDFETGTKIRTSVGFFTRGVDNPTADKHPELTARFRTVERLSQAIIASRSKVLKNPVVDFKGDWPGAAGVVITAVDWKSSGGSQQEMTNDVGPYANPIEVTLTIQGSMSALLATQAAIEKIADPIVIVTGGVLGTRGNFRAGERKSIASEPVQLKLNLVVLDFTKSTPLLTADMSAVGAGGVVPGAPAAATNKGGNKK